jgi:hypothetical protein
VLLSPKEPFPACSVYQAELALGVQNSGAFVDPPLDSNAEIDSFNHQAAAVNFTKAPKALNEAMIRLEDMYRECRWNVEEDFGSHAHITRVALYVLKNGPSKSPGAIYLRAGHGTNKDVFDAVGIAGVVRAVELRVAELLLGTDPRYSADPIRLFIKREAHKASKAIDKRWRIIWGISLVDQIIDRMLYTPMCDAELANCATIPSKPGYSFKYGGVDRMVRMYSNGSKKWISFDAKSFDISAPGWGLAAVRTVNERLCLNPYSPAFRAWCNLSIAREEAVLYGRFVFSNGVVCEKTHACIQPSGRFTTISTNCKLVVLLRIINDIEEGRESSSAFIIAMGDDTVQDALPDPEIFVKQVKERYGVTFTVESKVGEFASQNFCSTEFKKLSSGVFVPVPLNWQKNTHELCHPEAKVAKSPLELKENRGSALQSLCCEYAFHDKFEELHSLLARYNPEKFRSKEYFQGIVTGWESGLSGGKPLDRLCANVEEAVELMLTA